MENLKTFEDAMRGNRARATADILRRRAQEARAMAESLERLADQLDADFPAEI